MTETSRRQGHCDNPNMEDITDRMSFFGMRDINNEEGKSGIKQKVTTKKQINTRKASYTLPKINTELQSVKRKRKISAPDQIKMRPLLYPRFPECMDDLLVSRNTSSANSKWSGGDEVLSEEEFSSPEPPEMTTHSPVHEESSLPSGPAGLSGTCTHQPRTCLCMRCQLMSRMSRESGRNVQFWGNSQCFRF
ncbi:unnamed protein product [Mytilus coruscus]|uniref:Uncharacterized protein n=1 Tax=Mytilus coruscus TaxID=42192 RepID=A0A6J8EE25_MYTCO|nr:unnamed protein product [Mytilus coruscus]